MLSPPTLRRFAVLLPLVAVAAGLPVVRPATVPQASAWSMALTRNGPLRAPGEFALVGVSWPSARRVDGVSVRTSRDGSRWSTWRALDVEVDHGPDGPSERSVTKPLWTGASRLAEVRFGGTRPPPGTRLHVVDPGADPTSPLPTAAASPSRPGIITRAQWGADESIRRGRPEYAEPLKMAVVHHTATGDSYSRSESARIVRAIYTYHVKTNGWNDIGYNFLVDRFGQIFEGRAGGVQRSVVGAHASGFNKHSAGVAVIGNFDRAKPPEVAMQTLKRLVAWRLDQAWVDPAASLSYISGGSSKWPAGTKVTLKAVSAHNDVGKTACPGQPIYGALGWLRDAAARTGLPKLFEPKLSRSVITPNRDGYSDGLRFTGRFSSSVSWKVDVVTPDGAVRYSAAGAGTTFNVAWYGKDTSGRLVSHDDYRFRVAASNSSGKVRATHLPFEVWRYPNGTFFISSSRRTYILSSGKLRHPSSWQARSSRYRAGEGVAVPDAVSKVYPVSADIGFREGSVLRADGKLYVISDGKRRPTTDAALAGLRYDRDAVIETTAGALGPHKLGDALRLSDGIPNGAALRSSDVREAWLMSGVARPFLTTNIRYSYLIRDVDLVGPADDRMGGGTSAQAIGFRDGTLVRASGNPTVYVIADGLRRPVGTRTFAQMGYKSSNIRTATDAELALHRQGEPL